MIDEELILIVPTIHPHRGKKGAPIVERAFIPNAFPLTMQGSLGATAAGLVRGWYHDGQDELSGLVYRARHSVQQWFGRRAGILRPGRLADRGSHRWPCAGRHHGRKSDALP